MATVGLPLTGVGDATAQVAVDLIGVEAYQRMKIHDGLDGSTRPLRVLATTPGAADEGMVVRPIGSTAFSQAVVGAVGLTSGSSAVGITSGSSAVELTSAGSTRLAGRFTIDNPTTSVTLTSGSTATIIGAAVISSGSTAFLMGAVAVSSGVVLGAGSSANMLGQVQATGTTKVDSSTKVDVSSGVILGAGSSANMLGTVVVSSGTTAITVGSVALLAGTSANMLGTVVVSSGTTAITVGSVALLAGSSANMLGTLVISSGTTAITVGSIAILAGGSTIGSVQQGLGSTANFWFQQSIPFSSGNLARSTVNTTIDISVIAANASRKALVIANLSTVQIVGLGLSTGAVTTALTNVNLFLPANSQLSFGFGGGLPLFLGPVRGINISSTVVAGGVAVMEFT